jgi:hypothetical protein
VQVSPKEWRLTARVMQVSPAASDFSFSKKEK